MQTTRNRGALLNITGLVILLLNNAEDFPTSASKFVDQVLENTAAERSIAAWLNPESNIVVREMPTYSL